VSSSFCGLWFGHDENKCMIVSMKWDVGLRWKSHVRNEMTDVYGVEIGLVSSCGFCVSWRC